MSLPKIFKISQKRYIDADGRRCRKATPGAVEIVTKSAEWYADIPRVESARDRIERRKLRLKAPRRERVKLCADKRAAQEMLRSLIDARDRKAAGVVDYRAQANQPLGVLIEDYQQYLRSKGGTAGYVKMTISRLETVFRNCGFVRIADLDSARAADWLYFQRQKPIREEQETPIKGYATSFKEIAKAFGVCNTTVTFWRRRGAPIIARGKSDLRAIFEWRESVAESMGASTCNHYVTALKGFGRWLVKTPKRIDSNPFEELSKIEARADIRKQRRVLNATEFNRLIEAAKESPFVLRGFSGEDRAMIYMLAAYTGLRAGEISSLRKSSFDLKSKTPTVTVEASYTKNKDRAVIPLRADLAERLSSYLDSRKAMRLSIDKGAEKVWPGNWKTEGVDLIRRDLESAGIPYSVDGKDYDFHALRHQFITNLAEAGVHPRKAQVLARHSSIELTMKRYTQIGINDAAADIERLSPIPTGASERLKTGSKSGA